MNHTANRSRDREFCTAAQKARLELDRSSGSPAGETDLPSKINSCKDQTSQWSATSYDREVYVTILLERLGTRSFYRYTHTHIRALSPKESASFLCVCAYADSLARRHPLTRHAATISEFDETYSASFQFCASLFTYERTVNIWRRLNRILLHAVIAPIAT